MDSLRAPEKPCGCWIIYQLDSRQDRVERSERSSARRPATCPTSEREHAMARREDTAHLDEILSAPEDRHTLAESITGRLRQLILDGRLRPGQALRPADLAPRLGVSAMPIREALRILEAEGLVTFKPRIGARVAEIREEDVEELYLVRGALEGLAARLAATNVTDADLAGLHEAFDEMTAARARNDFDTFSQYDKEFHRR